MKNLIRIIFVLLPVIVSAQNITQVEYYIDADPGFGNGTSVSITAAADLDLSFTADLSSVGDGFHVLYVRAKDADGDWSVSAARPFLKVNLSTETPLNITHAEYYVDSDPGFGSGTAISITAAADLDLSFTADLSSVGDGFHVLYVRAKDADGDWSVSTARPFLKSDLTTEASQNITEVEYYIDSDPGFGNGTSVSISAATDLDLSFTSDLSSVSDGVHVLYMRAKDADGDWSVAMARPFLKSDLSSETPPNITSLEWYFEKSGITSSTFSKSDFTPSNDLTLDFTADVSSLDVDSTYDLHLIALDADGERSLESVHQFNIAVTNDAPTVLNLIPDIIADEDFETFTVALLDTVFSDLNLPSDSLRYSVNVDKNIVTASLIGDTLRLFSVKDSSGTAQLIVTATDDSSASVSDTFNVTLNPVNDAPMITSSATDTGTEDQLFVYKVTATDAEGDALTYTFSNLSTWLSAAGDSVTGTPTEEETSGSFRVIVSDGTLKDTLDVAVTVNAANDAPIFTSADSVLGTEDQLFVYKATATDLEMATLTFSFSNLSTWLTSAGDTIFGTPTEGVTAGAFRVIVSDGTLEDTLDVTIAVAAVNDAPVITSSATASGTEDLFFYYQATATDPDGDTLTFSFSNLSTWLSVTGDTIFGTPSEGVTGGSFRVIVSDDTLKDSIDVNITVAAVNDPPLLSGIPSIILDEDSTFSLDLDPFASDIDNDTTELILTAEILQPVVSSPISRSSERSSELNTSKKHASNKRYASGKTIETKIMILEKGNNEIRSTVHLLSDAGSIADSILIEIDSVTHVATITPNANYFASNILIVFVVTDPDSLSATDTVSITVTPVNDAPMFVDFPDSVEIVLGEADTLILSEFGFDIDDPDSVLIWSTLDCIGADTIACVTMNADTAFIRTIGDISGFEELTFLVTDTSGASDSASVIIYVKASVGIAGNGLIPLEYSLADNYPNPFNPQTTISYGLPKQSDLSLIIYNLMGQEIMRWDEQNSQAGFYQKIWNGRNKFGVSVGSGVYFYRIIAGDFVQTRKMVLLK